MGSVTKHQTSQNVHALTSPSQSAPADLQLFAVHLYCFLQQVIVYYVFTEKLNCKIQECLSWFSLYTPALSFPFALCLHWHSPLSYSLRALSKRPKRVNRESNFLKDNKSWLLSCLKLKKHNQPTFTVAFLIMSTTKGVGFGWAWLAACLAWYILVLTNRAIFAGIAINELTDWTVSCLNTENYDSVTKKNDKNSEIQRRMTCTQIKINWIQNKVTGTGRKRTYTHRSITSIPMLDLKKKIPIHHTPLNVNNGKTVDYVHIFGRRLGHNMILTSPVLATNVCIKKVMMLSTVSKYVEQELHTCYLHRIWLAWGSWSRTHHHSVLW